MNDVFDSDCSFFYSARMLSTLQDHKHSLGRAVGAAPFTLTV